MARSFAPCQDSKADLKRIGSLAALIQAAVYTPIIAGSLFALTQSLAMTSVGIFSMAEPIVVIAVVVLLFVLMIWGFCGR